MNVLSLELGAHDDSGALIHGNHLYAVESERLTRVKHSCNHDALTAAYTADRLGERNTRSKIKAEAGDARLRTAEYLLAAADLEWDDVDICIGLEGRSRLDFDRGFTHHQDHAASAFWPSGFNEAAIVIVDLFGESLTTDPLTMETSSLWFGNREGIENLHTYYSVAYQFNKEFARSCTEHESLGVFYADLTIACGFGVLDGGKTMGLSAYGTPAVLEMLREFIDLRSDGRVIFDRAYQPRLEELCQARADSFEFKADVAYAAQKVLEEVVFAYCDRVVAETGCRQICLAGGLALNAVANGLLLERNDVDDLFVQPASNDAGTSLGRALNVFYSFSENASTSIDYRCFQNGAIYDTTASVAQLRSRPDLGVRDFDDFDELCRLVAGLIAQGHIIGWFQGRSEFGPRALGNRSILCDPTHPAMKETLNDRIKFREWFRPFAPAVLEERSVDFFRARQPSPFMTIVVHCTTDRLPATTHHDSTARLQTVSAAHNERFYRLIKEFDRQTGVPILLNTSFNIKGEPIVETPQDAVDTFLRSELDHLVLGNTVVSKLEHRHASAFC